MAVTVIDAKGELEAYIAQTAGEPAPADKVEEKAADPTKKADEAAQKTAKGADEPDPDDPDDQEGDDGLTPRQKRELSAKMLKAIGKKHREMKEAEEFAAAQYSEKRLAESRAAALEQELRQLRASQPDVSREAADPEAGKPQRDKFQTDEAYWEAVIDWRADQKISAQRAKDEKAAAERRKVEIETAAASRITRAQELVPDFAEVGRAADGMISQVITDYLLKSEMIAEVTYHLAKHPKLVAELAKLPPDEQLVTIGKIEGTLKPFEPKGSKTTNGATPSNAANGHDSSDNESSDTGSTPSRTRSTAPVITPLSSSSAVQVEKSAADMNTRELISSWQKQHRANLNLRKRH